MAAVKSINESIIDDEYLERKKNLAIRVAENRAKRMRFRQELVEYKKIKETGSSTLESDPQTNAAVLRIEADLNSETELQEKVDQRLQKLNLKKIELQQQFQEFGELIQKHKVSGTQINTETQKIRLQQSKDKLNNEINIKEAKKINLSAELKKLTASMKIRTRQDALISIVTNWQQGDNPSETAESKLLIAFQYYSDARESWREARFAFDRKIMPEFFVHCWKALKYAVNCYYILIKDESIKDEELFSNDLHDRIDLLFKNKIIVSTTLVESLKSLSDRIDRGVAVKPNPRYKDDVLEFLTKNMGSLKIS